MAGFNPDSLKKLCQNFYFIALKDSSDEPRIIKRMEAFKNLFGKNGLIVETIELQGLNQFHKIFSSVILAEWTGYYLAKEYGFGTEAPIIEEFKKLIATRG